MFREHGADEAIHLAAVDSRVEGKNQLRLCLDWGNEPSNGTAVKSIGLKKQSSVTNWIER